MKKTYEHIPAVLELIGDAIEGGGFLLNKLRKQEFDAVFYSVLDSISESVNHVKKAIEPYLSDETLRKNALIPFCECIIHAAKEFQDIPPKQQRHIEFTFRNEILAALQGLYDVVEFTFITWPDPEKRQAYWDYRKELCYQARQLNVTKALSQIDHPYEVTIVIMTYNLLDYFSQCLESILKYTDFEKHKVQLIVFNHGSTDGTLEYLKKFHHLDYLKIHNCHVNIKNEMNFLTNHSTWYDTKYTMVIANDTIATQNYLDNLLRCIKSDDRIAWICPAMPNTSGAQRVNGDYESVDELPAFAEKFNHSDPSKWMELARLIPVFSMYNNVCYRAFNFGDPSYYEMFFGDDDISRSAIRSNFRLIGCKDTYIHHYPSMTVHRGNDIGERYDAMRKIFFQKYGYDAWGFQKDIGYMLRKLTVPNNRPCKILYIEPGMGEIVQQIKTLFRINGIEQHLESHSVTFDPKYIMDMEGFSDTAHLLGGYDEFSQVCQVQSYDIVVISKRLEEIYVDYDGFFAEISKLLVPGGTFICCLTNPNNLESILEQLTWNMSHNAYSEESNYPKTYCDINFISMILNKYGILDIELSQAQSITETAVTKELHDRLVAFLNKSKAKSETQLFNAKSLILKGIKK